ncbi:MAG: hypothetical protein U9N35_03175 [Euryarchaeota archaeon]|nr:hypothetical protein [Euryarchaeota archaeon]
MTKKLDEWFGITTYAVFKSIYDQFGEGGYSIIRTMGKYIYRELEERVDLDTGDPKEAVRRMTAYAKDLGYISELEIAWGERSIELKYTSTAALGPIEKLTAEKCKILPCFFTSAVVEALRKRGVNTEISESTVDPESDTDTDILRIIKV